jgi:hypothetical protein
VENYPASAQNGSWDVVIELGRRVVE